MNADLRDRYRYQILGNGQSSPRMKRVFEIISKRHIETGVSDGPAAMEFSQDDVQEIQKEQWEEIRANEVQDGAISMGTIRDRLTVSIDRLNKDLRKGLKKPGNRIPGEAIDAFYNNVTGIGTGVDPGVWNAASTPVSISPQEATAMYSNGGIAGEIIDKKAKGIFINGYQFVGEEWKPEWLDELKKHAESRNFEGVVKDWWRDGYIYGGALAIPALRGDTPISYLMTIEQLAKGKMLDKDCIDYFWEVDRWNSVLIPNYTVSAEDYLTPAEFMVPIAGISVSRERMAIGRPKRLPYWGMLRQMGWGISDFPSFMPSLLAYEMSIRAIPIISQQLSLVYLHAPFDAIIAQSGLNAAKKLSESNGEKLRSWSMLQPEVLNLVGELKTLERHFTDFDDLILLLKQDVGAKSGISHTILFNEMQPGQDEKNYDVTLKQAAVIQQSGKEASLQLRPLIQMLVYSCFGYGSEQAKLADKVNIQFDSPAVLTNEERMDMLTAFVNAVNGLVQAGMQLVDAIEIARGQVPQLEISEEILKRLALFVDDQEDPGEGSTEKRPGFFDAMFKRHR